MPKQYHMDLRRYTLEKFKNSLANREMIPSRVMLKEQLEEHFATLQQCGITNLKELTTRCKNKAAVQEFAAESGLSSKYLTLLKREGSSLLPSPVKLSAFPDVDPEVITKLEAHGIKHSKHLFMRLQKDTASELANEVSLAPEQIEELASLSDLGRLYGVGPVFARLVYDTGVHSITDFVTYSGEEFIALYEEKMQKKADFGLADINFSLEMAQELL